ncbi:unnamed protein product, partial [Oppiella nova]
RTLRCGTLLHEQGGKDYTIIISAKWAITAAHCVEGVAPSARTLRCGTLLHEQGGKDYTISEMIMHPDYDKPTIINNDIALLKINDEFDIGTPDSDIIKLPTKDSELTPGTIVTVTGWGYLVNGGGSSPATLQTVDLPVVDRGYCAERNNHVAPVTNSMFCAGVPEGGKDACQNDSGGPVKYNGELVGIVSWGKQCALPDYPGVYARVSVFRDWIKQSTVRLE